MIQPCTKGTSSVYTVEENSSNTELCDRSVGLLRKRDVDVDAVCHEVAVNSNSGFLMSSKP